MDEPAKKHSATKGEMAAVIRSHGPELWGLFVEEREIIKARLVSEGQYQGKRHALIYEAWRQAYELALERLRGGVEPETLDEVPGFQDSSRAREWKRRLLEKEKQDIAVKALAKSASDANRLATTLDIQAWAFRNISIEWAEIPEHAAPDPGAPAYLAWLKTAKGRDLFFAEITKRAGKALTDTEATERSEDQDNAQRVCNLYKRAVKGGINDEHQDASMAG